MNKNGTENYELKTLGTGVEIKILPFPAALFDSLQEQAARQYPTPEPPEKTIDTFAGEEKIRDTEDPDYQREKKAIETLRDNWISEKVLTIVLDLCIFPTSKKDLENGLAKLTKYGLELPEDEDDRRVAFLKDFAIRTKLEYSDIILKSLRLTVVGDEEVADKLKSFQDSLE